MFTLTNRLGRHRPYTRPLRRTARVRRGPINPWLPQVVVAAVATVAFTGFGMVAIHEKFPTLIGFNPWPPTVDTQPAPEVPAPTEPNSPTDPVPPEEPGVPPTLPDGYAYLTSISGKPILVDACQPVSYHIDQAEMLPGGQVIITNAIAMATDMTGLTTIMDGDTTGTRISIAYKHEGEDPSLGGGAIGVAHVKSGGGLADGHITTVSISLEIEWFQTAIHDKTDLATMVVLHEILHANGLDHTDLTSSIMYPSAHVTSPSADDYRAARALNPGCAARATSTPMGDASSSISIPFGRGDFGEGLVGEASISGDGLAVGEEHVVMEQDTTTESANDKPQPL